MGNRIGLWLLVLLLFIVRASQANAQCSVNLGADTSMCAASFTMTPSLSVSMFEDSLEIIYDATQGQTGLVGASKVYMHSGAEMVPFGGWQYPVGNWGQDDGVGKMQSIGTDLWRIRILPHAYYGYPSSATPNGLFMVFRNADGSATGKDNSGNDIWVDMAQNPPTSAFGGLGLAWKEDALAGLLWSDNSTGSSLTVTQPGTYWVQMTDTGGCIARDSIVVQIGSIPILNLGTQPICDGVPVVLDAGAGYTSYLWSTGATTQTITVSTPSMIMVTVTNAAGCQGSDVLNIPAWTVPTAGFAPSISGLTVIFIDGSSDIDGAIYYWDFDNDGNNDGYVLGTCSHTYASPGTYTVRLVVRNTCGSDTAFQTIAVTNGLAVSEQFEGSFQLFPNPAKNFLTLQLDLPKGMPLSWSVLDGQGRTCLGEDEGRISGFFKKELDIHTLPAGIYHLRLWLNGKWLARSFVKI
jgi:PKD repeat protein